MSLRSDFDKYFALLRSIFSCLGRVGTGGTYVTPCALHWKINVDQKKISHVISAMGELKTSSRRDSKQ
jgi:hypothetical protein